MNTLPETKVKFKFSKAICLYLTCLIYMLEFFSEKENGTCQSMYIEERRDEG